MKRFIVFLLSLMGISTLVCCKYAAPTSSFELKGKVTDTQNNPINDIQVELQQNGHRISKSITDETGNYYIITYVEPVDYGTVVAVRVEDIDGEENGGEFVTQIITFPVKKTDYIKDGKRGDLEEGTASKETNFKLIPK